jgi:hypothetical protein
MEQWISEPSLRETLRYLERSSPRVLRHIGLADLYPRQESDRGLTMTGASHALLLASSFARW